MTKHVPVMSKEVLEYLKAHQAGQYLDCTLGGGGHSQQILNANSSNKLVAMDRDPEAIERSQVWSPAYEGRLKIYYASFKTLEGQLGEEKFDGVLADLGTSVDQLEGERGFSFRKSAPLDMRMDPAQELTASTLVNEASEHDLFVILRKGGMGSEARAIARAIVRARPISDSEALGELVASVARRTDKEQGKSRHAATLAFQAIRIAVNDEFSEIEALLDLIPKISRAGTRVVIISFHSLEDKLVAGRMRTWENPSSTPALWAGPSQSNNVSFGKLLTRKALTPCEQEILENPKSRSARIRVFEFSAGGFI